MCKKFAVSAGLLIKVSVVCVCFSSEQRKLLFTCISLLLLEQFSFLLNKETVLSLSVNISFSGSLNVLLY